MKRAFISSLRHCVVLGAVAAIVGCSEAPKTYPVRGIVRFPDGKLLQSGSIEFEGAIDRKERVVARGMVGADGSFVLGTYTVDDGAVLGEHRVVVISDQIIGNSIERPELLEERPQQLHPKYRDFNRSGLVFTVEPKENEFLVEVDYAPQDKPAG